VADQSATPSSLEGGGRHSSSTAACISGAGGVRYLYLVRTSRRVLLPRRRHVSLRTWPCPGAYVPSPFCLRRGGCAAAAVGAGIGPGVVVAASGTREAQSCSRWLLLHFGPTTVAVLLGGIGRWCGRLVAPGRRRSSLRLRGRASGRDKSVSAAGARNGLADSSARPSSTRGSANPLAGRARTRSTTFPARFGRRSRSGWRDATRAPGRGGSLRTAAPDHRLRRASRGPRSPAATASSIAAAGASGLTRASGRAEPVINGASRSNGAT